MGARTVARAYPGITAVDFVPHTPFLPGLWSGVLQVGLRFSEEHPLVVGAGQYVLRGGAALSPRERTSLGPRRQPAVAPPEKPPEVVADIVRRNGVPVLPGSSLKGAVRQVFELLTPSCALAPQQACKVKVKDATPRVCLACSLFGAAGLGGRVAFGEAVPGSGGVSQPRAPRVVPLAWEPRKWTDGTLRTYDPSPAVPREVRGPVKTGLTWAVWGDLWSRVRVVNASDEELGLLFAALGVRAPSPMLRVGGKKYHGFGAADVLLAAAVRSAPARAVVPAAEVVSWAKELTDRALAVGERRAAWEALHAALAGKPTGKP
jgi:hypothetical protein